MMDGWYFMMDGWMVFYDGREDDISMMDGWMLLMMTWNGVKAIAIALGFRNGWIQSCFLLHFLFALFSCIFFLHLFSCILHFALILFGNMWEVMVLTALHGLILGQCHTCTDEVLSLSV